MEKIFFNGCIRTLDDAGCVAEAVGIENGKIAFIGTNEEAQKIPCEEKTDLQGRLLLPGLVDTHLHMLHYAFVERSVKLFDCCQKKFQLSWSVYADMWQSAIHRGLNV